MIKNFKKNLNSHASVIKSLNKLFLLKKIERLAKDILIHTKIMEKLFLQETAVVVFQTVFIFLQS